MRCSEHLLIVDIAWPVVQNSVQRWQTISLWQNDTNGIFTAGIPRFVTEPALVGCIACIEETMLATIDDSDLRGVWKGDDCLAAEQRNIPGKHEQSWQVWKTMTVHLLLSWRCVQTSVVMSGNDTQIGHDAAAKQSVGVA